MHPGCTGTLQNDSNQCGSGGVQHAFFTGVPNDLVVRSHQGSG